MKRPRDEADSHALMREAESQMLFSRLSETVNTLREVLEETANTLRVAVEALTSAGAAYSAASKRLAPAPCCELPQVQPPQVQPPQVQLPQVPQVQPPQVQPPESVTEEDKGTTGTEEGCVRTGDGEGTEESNSHDEADIEWVTGFRSANSLRKADKCKLGFRYLRPGSEKERIFHMYLQLFLHAANCNGKECASRNCVKTKEWIKHEMECNIELNGCLQCRRMCHLHVLHATICKLEVCRVPNCSMYRERIKATRMRPYLIDDTVVCV